MLNHKLITYYTNKTAEQWSPKSLDRGIGGSQTAVIYLSQIWAKEGFEVEVYCNLDGQEGVYNGVKYHDYKKFDPSAEKEVLIIWRDLEILDQDIRAKKIYLDLHDEPSITDYTKKRLAKIKKIFVKSEYHKSLLPMITHEKVIIIPNGVDVDLFKSNQNKRDGYRLIYASDYYRGLELMLRYGWPVIREKIPRAELDIFYGWDFFDIVWKNDPQKQNWKKMMIKLMNQPGVIEHGRIGQGVLATHLKKASILYYGCNFKEIDCITVRQAAIAGCVPCTTNYAVLAEKNYVKKFSGDPFDKETQITLAQEIASLLNEKTSSKIDSMRSDFGSKAAKESWEWVAKQWLGVLGIVR